MVHVVTVERVGIIAVLAAAVFVHCFAVATGAVVMVPDIITVVEVEVEVVEVVTVHEQFFKL